VLATTKATTTTTTTTTETTITTTITTTGKHVLNTHEKKMAFGSSNEMMNSGPVGVCTVKVLGFCVKKSKRL
jgi:hypothetical protein